jgi:Tol biopolymer transport system component
MALSPGQRFGSYEIAEAIGAGGMGEVYRATDTNLKRDVAVKVLPESFATDADRLARFQREAEVLASLNHANIATIHGLEKADGQTVIVMELVEGQTLAERVADGPIPPDEAMRIAMQVASALEAAHGRQIVHRDLKPANVKVKDDGTVKVLDFGISKPLDASAISGGAVMTTPAVTATGVILGTAAYMSPEQARGKPVDQRTDIWAFGCLLFEMLTGQPAFGGEDVMAVLARVIDRDTDLSSMPAMISPAVRHTLKLCLEKNPDKRIADIRDVRLALGGVFESELPRTAEVAIATPLWRRALPVALAVGATAVIVGVGSWLALEPAPQTIARFAYDLPEAQVPRGTNRQLLALSPDGRRFAYNTTDGIYLRELGQLDARLIPGTEEDLTSPFFSPDGESLAYFTPDGARLKRIAISGGAPVVIADALINLFGASWGTDGSILVGQPQGIMRVSANGGEPELVIPARDGELPYGPTLLPDGDHVLFTSGEPPNWDSGRIVAESLTTGERTVLVEGGSDARYVASGHLIYTLADGLFAVAFDAASLRVSGGPVPLLQGLWRSSPQTPAANYDLAENGTLIYLNGDQVSGGGATPGGTLTWVDHSGNAEPVGADPCACIDLSLSPDGTRAALSVLETAQTGTDIWVWSFESETLSRLTFEPAIDVFASWSPDSRRVVYRRLDGLYVRPADGTGTPERVFETTAAVAPFELTANNEVIFAQAAGSGATTERQDVIALDLAAGSEQLPVLATSFDEGRPALSPDGRWLAYESDETGQREIYVRPYPNVDSGKWQVSTNGGAQPLWAPDNSKLYFVGPGQLMEADVETDPTFRRQTPRVLFALDGFQISPNTRRDYDVSADGERFLMLRTSADSDEGDADTGSFKVMIALNWQDELERLVPTN